MSMDRPLVGVFDSGFGGLTVLRELLHWLPGADFLYLGDTARLPYGNKSADTIRNFTLQAIRFFHAQGADGMVVACNTASALALPDITEAPFPIAGVVLPGAAAARAASPAGGTALVLATAATVASHAYARACADEGLSAFEQACPLLVPLVEEGWIEGSITAEVADVYLREALTTMVAVPNVAVLGCTHYPLLRPLLKARLRAMVGDIPVVDAAEATALRALEIWPDAAQSNGVAPHLEFFATDSAEKFQRLGERFLGRAIPYVTAVDLDDPRCYAQQRTR